MNCASHVKEVCQLAGNLASKGWLPATSGNLSVRVDDQPLRIAVTRSGADKQSLRAEDVLLVDERQQTLASSPYRPSAETIVHIELYKQLPCRAILHVHTVYNNLISDCDFPDGFVQLSNHELLKALDHWEPNASIRVPIVENHHDIPRLAQAVRDAARDDVPGVLVRNHGIYAWGDSGQSAIRFLEAFEFLFEYEFKRRQYDFQQTIARQTHHPVLS